MKTVALPIRICQDVHMKLSTLGYALLGLLIDQPQTGYALSQNLKNPVSFFWHAQHSQIYPELCKLEQLGLVQFEHIEQSERPDKKIYNITPSGLIACQAWLEQSPDVPKIRDELVLKVFLLRFAKPQAALSMLQQHALAHRQRLEFFVEKLADLEQKEGSAIWKPSSKWFGAHAALRRGIGYQREYLEWCEWVMACLERGF
jgi:DNA-binding PadR family transcriptional regulator